MILALVVMFYTLLFVTFFKSIMMLPVYTIVPKCEHKVKICSFLGSSYLDVYILLAILWQPHQGFLGGVNGIAGQRRWWWQWRSRQWRQGLLLFVSVPSLLRQRDLVGFLLQLFNPLNALDATAKPVLAWLWHSIGTRWLKSPNSALALSSMPMNAGESARVGNLMLPLQGMHLNRFELDGRSPRTASRR